MKYIEAKKQTRFTRRELLVGFSVILAIAVSLLFPVSAIGEIFWMSLALFAVFPIVIIKFLLKEPLSKFGLVWGNTKAGIFGTILFTAAGYAIMIAFVNRPEFRNQMGTLPGIGGNFVYFLWTEILIVPVIFLSRELFFRGFFQLGLEARLGIYSIPLQAILSTLPFYRASWFIIINTLILALGAGLITRLSRSIAYSFASLWIISVVADIMMIRIASQGT